MNYKAIDIFSKYDEEVPKSNDIINIDDPNCRPSLLVFIDVKPELTIEPETNIIKQEIKDIHKIWINDENIYDYKDGHNNESYEFDAVKNKEISKNFKTNYDNDVDDDIPLQSHHHNQKHYDTDYDEAIPEPKRQRNISENYNHHNNYTNLCAFTSTFALQPGNNYLQYK
jgi:hypothetical protein